MSPAQVSPAPCSRDISIVAACLAAILALVESLGAFLAPHLPALLGVLLAPGVLRCHAARCADAAAAVRAKLAGGVPPRLLLGPLLGHLEPAVEVGGAVKQQGDDMLLEWRLVIPQKAKARSSVCMLYVAKWCHRRLFCKPCCQVAHSLGLVGLGVRGLV